MYSMNLLFSEENVYFQNHVIWIARCTWTQGVRACWSISEDGKEKLHFQGQCIGKWKSKIVSVRKGSVVLCSKNIEQQNRVSVSLIIFVSGLFVVWKMGRWARIN
jgi:hypothetical protein